MRNCYGRIIIQFLGIPQEALPKWAADLLQSLEISALPLRCNRCEFCHSRCHHHLFEIVARSNNSKIIIVLRVGSGRTLELIEFVETIRECSCGSCDFLLTLFPHQELIQILVKIRLRQGERSGRMQFVVLVVVLCQDRKDPSARISLETLSCCETSS
jgi:hypothetical protein